MDHLRNHFWLWGQTPGSHHATGVYKLPGVNTMNSAEGCRFFGIPNCCRVAMSKGPFPPFDEEADALDGLEKVVWSVIGAGGVARNEDNCGDLDEVLRIAALHPNVIGAVMDDFFHNPRRLVIFTPEKLRGIRERLHKELERKLEFWTVYYDREMHLDVAPLLAEFDVITFWTWKSEDLPKARENFERLIAMTPGKRHLNGCYMYDYGNNRPMGLSDMKKQAALYEELLLSGRSDGLVLCSNCCADVGLETVPWTRDWLRELGRNEVN